MGKCCSKTWAINEGQTKLGTTFLKRTSWSFCESASLQTSKESQNPSHWEKWSSHWILSTMSEPTSMKLDSHVNPSWIICEIGRSCFFCSVIELTNFFFQNVIIALTPKLFLASYDTFGRTVCLESLKGVTFKCFAKTWKSLAFVRSLTKWDPGHQIQRNSESQQRLTQLHYVSASGPVRCPGELEGGSGNLFQ